MVKEAGQEGSSVDWQGHRQVPQLHQSLAADGKRMLQQLVASECRVKD